MRLSMLAAHGGSVQRCPRCACSVGGGGLDRRPAGADQRALARSRASTVVPFAMPAACDYMVLRSVIGAIIALLNYHAVAART